MAQAATPEGSQSIAGTTEQVDHLIFFIHGVGGICDVKFRPCVEVVADFKKMANELLAHHHQHSQPPSGRSTPPDNNPTSSTSSKKGFFRKHSNDSTASRGSIGTKTQPATASPTCPVKRVECIPISWHSLTRRQIGINEQLNLISLSSVSKLRGFLNKVVMDAMLYSSGPIYSQRIIDNVAEEINRLYTFFMERNPDFLGSVSFAGHSLGSVILFDLLAHQVPVSPPIRTTENTHSVNAKNHEVKFQDPKAEAQGVMYDPLDTGQYPIVYPQLKFQPRCFFAFGCPMPMFLNIRGIKNLDKDYKLPTCDHMLNIFHPYDPLAYRFEPLIDPRYKDVEPIQIPHHRGGKRMHVQIREGFARVGSGFKHLIFGSIRDTWTSLTGNSASNNAERSRSPSVDSSLECARRRLTKSASSSVETEMESFDSETTTMSHDTYRKRQAQLKRQNQFVRSQSEVDPRILTDIFERSAMKSFKGAVKSGISTSPVNLMPDLENLDLGDRENNNAEVTSTEQQHINVKSNSTNDKNETKLLFKRKKSKKIKQEKEKEKEKTKKGSVSSLHSDSLQSGNLNSGRRLDYVLQEKPIELFNEYIFAFTSHASYWENEDCALLMLNEIYKADDIQIFDCCEWASS